MRFERRIEELRAAFPHGRVTWTPGEPLGAVLNGAGVADEPGVYVLRALGEGAAETVYVGRAGTICSDGKFKGQKLLGRLQAKQGGVSRQEFFRRKLEEGRFTGLQIEWFVTWDMRNKSAPALVEAELLQAWE